MDHYYLTYTIPILLSMEIFFLSISGGVTMSSFNWKLALKNSLIFAAVTLLGAIVGLLFSMLLGSLLSGIALITGSLLVGFMGVKMMIEAHKIKNIDRTFLLEDNGILWPLAIASSLNTLIFYVGLGLMEVPFLKSMIIIFICTLLFSIIGQFFGSHYRPLRLGRYSKFAGGFLIVLVIILNYFV